MTYVAKHENSDTKITRHWLVLLIIDTTALMFHRCVIYVVDDKKAKQGIHTQHPIQGTDLLESLQVLHQLQQI